MFNCNFCAYQSERSIEINMHLKLEHNIHIIQSDSMKNIKEESKIDIIQVLANTGLVFGIWYKTCSSTSNQKFKIIVSPLIKIETQ